MLRLIYKDLLLQKKMIFFVLGYGFFLFFIFNKPIHQDVVYNMGTIATSYIMLLTAIAFDEKNNTYIIFNSIPLSRKKIVLEKYLFALVTVLIGLVIMGVLGAFIKISGIITIKRFINVNDLLFSLASVLLLTSVYLPLYLKLGYKYSRYINLFLFLLFFFLPSWLIDFLNNSPSSKGAWAENITHSLLITPTWILGSALVLIALILAGLSCKIALGIYMNKDF